MMVEGRGYWDDYLDEVGQRWGWGLVVGRLGPIGLRGYTKYRRVDPTAYSHIIQYLDRGDIDINHNIPEYMRGHTP